MPTIIIEYCADYYDCLDGGSVRGRRVWLLAAWRVESNSRATILVFDDGTPTQAILKEEDWTEALMPETVQKEIATVMSKMLALRERARKAQEVDAASGQTATVYHGKCRILKHRCRNPSAAPSVWHSTLLPLSGRLTGGTGSRSNDAVANSARSHSRGAVDAGRRHAAGVPEGG